MSPSPSTVPVVPMNIANNDDPILSEMTNESKKMVSIVTSTFETRFKSNASFLVKVPGRVNLIGDHIDYCGFPVLPMALDQGMWFAVNYSFKTTTSGDSQSTMINVHNVNSVKYVDFETDLSQEIEINSLGKPTWKDYFLSGIKGTINQLSPTIKTKLFTTISTINVVCHGNVIPSSGLSSSSALVSGSVTVFNHLLDVIMMRNNDDGDHDQRMNKTRLAQLSANSERLIGTESGGMDQAIAFLAEKSTAKYIEFEPNLRGTSILIPSSITFFISHSNVTCNKGSDDQYNCRVLDTRIGSALMYHHWLSTNYLPENLIASSNELRSKKGFLQLSDILRIHVQCINQNSGHQVSETDLVVFNELITLIDSITSKFNGDSYRIENVLDQLNIKSVDELMSLIAGKSPDSWVRFKKVIQDRSSRNEFYKIKSRVEHVFTESSLVEQFREICSDHATNTKCNNTNAMNEDDDVIFQLGNLLKRSQDTMRTKCESSVKEVDELVELSLKCGSLGTRISGAGFGGCVVALVPVIKRNSYQQSLKQSRPEDEFTFESSPSAGVTIFEL